MSDKITRLDDHRHLAVLARCLFCRHAWTFEPVVGTELSAVPCPKCHSQNTIARVL